MRHFIVNLIFLLLIFHQSHSQQPQIAPLKTPESLASESPGATFVKIKKRLANALANGDEHQMAICYEQIGELFYDQAAYSQALLNYYKADTHYRKANRLLELAGNLNNIGRTYYYNRQYPSALKTFEQALTNYQKLEDHRGIAESYGYIGQAYEKTGLSEKAFDFQKRALAAYKNTNDQFGIAKIYENLGSIYEDSLQLDSALKYFISALALNQKLNKKTAQIEIINNIGDVYRKTGQLREALSYTKKTSALAIEMKAQYQLASAYRDLSKTFHFMKRPDSAYFYSEAGREIFMDIFSQDSKKQLLLLQTLFETEQKDNAIYALEKDKKFNTIFTFGAVAISVLILSLGASIISRQRLKIKNEQELNEQNNALYEVKNAAMAADLELKSKELTSHTLHLIQKNQLLEELKSRLTEMIKDDKRDQRRELKQVIGLITINNNQEKNWNDFRIVFERVHEHFYERLKKYSTALTASELRLVALLKMNLSSPDISTMLGISQDSLRIARYRLRKKLVLAEGESLTSFLQRL